MFVSEKKLKELSEKYIDLSDKMVRLEAEYQVKKLVQEAAFQKWYADEYLKTSQEIAKLERACAVQKGEFEHEYHGGMEAKRIELAKIDALIEERTKSHGVHDEHLKDLGNIMKEVIKALQLQARGS